MAARGLDKTAGAALSEAAWAALQARAAWPEVYGVTTTGIHCRAGCPARTPLRGNLRAFAGAAEASAAGYRACKRCGGGV
jgi:methylphosphotriester-DNA--protein-cysteine methyltransferase